MGRPFPCSRLITLSHDVHPNPLWNADDGRLAIHRPLYYAGRLILLGIDIEMNPRPQHASFLTLNVGGPLLSRAPRGKLLQEITAYEPMIIPR